MNRSPSQFGWPQGQGALSEQELTALEDACKQEYRAACEEMGIPATALPLLRTMYLPWAAWLECKRAEASAPLVVGLTGGQGAGKSTVCKLLKVVLWHAFGRTAASLSIDDIYLTRDERRYLAREVHPLFATRGVPGTHDCALGIFTLEQMRCQGARGSMAIPSFDKATDERRPEAEWPLYRGKADYIIFEGWCVGARPQKPEALHEPVNALERQRDSKAIWRTAVNRELGGEYQRMFAMIDVQVLLHVGSIDRVFEWRRLQEHKLRLRAQSEGSSRRELRIMSDAQVDQFVMHYERLTRHMLEEMPGRADILFPLNETHNAARVCVEQSTATAGVPLSKSAGARNLAHSWEMRLSAL